MYKLLLVTQAYVMYFLTIKVANMIDKAKQVIIITMNNGWKINEHSPVRRYGFCRAAMFTSERPELD